MGLGFRYRGTYCGKDVAIKILKSERLNDSLQQEFAQEVYIMQYAHRLRGWDAWDAWDAWDDGMHGRVEVCRKVRHKNVVQFIGACTKPPNLSIVTGRETTNPYRDP